MSYNIKNFIDHAREHGEYINLRREDAVYTDADRYKEIPAEFARKFLADNRNLKQFPIIVWEYKRKPVAFWDCENLDGYILV